MKIKILLPTVLSALLLLASCEKYLDVKKNSSTTFIESADDCQRILDKYGVMNTGYPSDGQASCDDYYLGTNTFPGSLSQENKDIYTWQINAIRLSSTPQWVNPYYAIYLNNLVLENLDKISSKTDQATLNRLKGSALFLRSYLFWNLAQLYAKPYSTNNQDLGIPIRTSSDVNDRFERSTVKETYDQIVKDLEEAASLLPTTTSISTRPSKVAAYAMLARVYLSMEAYDLAQSNATLALQLKNDLLDYSGSDVNKSPSSNTPINRFNKEVIFHSLITSDFTSSSPLLDQGSATNPVARINLDIYNSFAANDWRKSVWFKLNTDGSVRFTGNYEPSTQELFNGLTTGELYLIRAECYARAGNISGALADLNALLISRWNTNGGATPYQTITATTAEDALRKVLLERRKELVMRGQRWTDLRRLNKDSRFKLDLIRTVTIGSSVTNYTLPANDNRYTLLIPLEVIQQGGHIQNPR